MSRAFDAIREGEHATSDQARAAANEKLDAAASAMADIFNGSLHEHAAHRVAHKRDEIERHKREVQAIAARAKPVLDGRFGDRQGLHVLLDTIIDLMPYAGEIGGPAEDAARKIGQALMLGCLGWAEGLHAPMPVHLFASMSPDARREELLLRLESAPYLMPPALMRELRDALRAAHEGSKIFPDLFRPSKHTGKGQNPAGADRCREELLCYIEWRRGCGVPKYHAEAEVAVAVSRGPEAVRKWKDAWDKRAGGEETQAALARHRQRGEQGLPFDDAGRTLRDLAAELSRCTQPARQSS
ncbi:hypothetical protein [Pseudoroseomonas cervicalis]|uniref:hypothetical protein n=1 Tax=Teichococcus cervicalis TaxID=204525 RepID=UPI0022F1B568|nr:hypothetical protein [Pseudoroseomonas cervicalis]WBV44028.1 hypothetical protein PFY06_05530 [Pseudoroseomonas cervicalis]